MHDSDDLKLGTRIRISTLGKERLPRISALTGKVVGIARSSQAVRILLDGKKKAITLHHSYIERDK